MIPNMKTRIGLLVATAAAVSAQNMTMSAGRTGTASPPPSYSLEIYTDCSPGPQGTITSTGTMTETYCSMCESAIHTTVWTTTYLNFCPTGMTEKVYTVTESCTAATPTWSTGMNHVPQGFVTGMETCTVCGPTPITAMMTYPSGSSPFEGTPTASRMGTNQSPSSSERGSEYAPSGETGSTNISSGQGGSSPEQPRPSSGESASPSGQGGSSPEQQSPSLGESASPSGQGGSSPEQQSPSSGESAPPSGGSSAPLRTAAAPSQEGNEGTTSGTSSPTEEGSEGSGHGHDHGTPGTPHQNQAMPSSGGNSTGFARYTGTAASTMEIRWSFIMMLSSAVWFLLH